MINYIISYLFTLKRDAVYIIRPLQIKENVIVCTLEKFSPNTNTPSSKTNVGVRYWKNPIDDNFDNFVPKEKRKSGITVTTPAPINKILSKFDASTPFPPLIISKYKIATGKYTNVSIVNAKIGSILIFFFAILYPVKVPATKREYKGNFWYMMDI